MTYSGMHEEMVTDLILYQFCGDNQGYCEFVNVIAMSYPEDTVL